MKQLLLFFIVTPLLFIKVSAAITLPPIFGENMILQQNQRNTLWGWATSGDEITVQASWGSVAKATANDKGKWVIHLETPQHGTGYSINVSNSTEKIEIKNVAIGEVWLCAGQSNMGWAVRNTFEAEKEANVQLPDFRIFQSASELWHEPLDLPRDRLVQWKTCDGKVASETSAVSYYFGKTLHQKLGIPVGIVVQAFAGTPIEGWMPE